MTVTETDPSDIIGDGVAAFDEELMQVGALGVVTGAAVFVLRKGWRLLKGLI